MSSSIFTSTASSNYSLFGGGRCNRWSRIEGGVTCEYGLRAPCWEAWRHGTVDLWKKDPKLKCDFFKWADPPYTERAREVTENLLEKLTTRFDEIMVLKDDYDMKDKELDVKDTDR